MVNFFKLIVIQTLLLLARQSFTNSGVVFKALLILKNK